MAFVKITIISRIHLGIMNSQLIITVVVFQPGPECYNSSVAKEKNVHVEF